ncbi:MAG TPA: J domain-containing protein [Methylomirabilota bacterium]|nr:J domain-containing protein [Methylomirabilota bacterium]
MADDLDRYYEILGLTPGASPEEIKQAYRDLAKVWHPDRFSDNDRLQQKAEEKLKDVNKAYQRLKSHRSRPKAVHQSGVRPPQIEPLGPGGHDQWWTVHPPLDQATPTRRSRSLGWPRVVAICCAAVLLASFTYYLNGRGGRMPSVSRVASSANAQQKVSENEQRNASPLSVPFRYFTLGSTREEVMEVQGAPDNLFLDVLQYGGSEVFVQDGRVVGWNNAYPRLKVRWLPATATTLSHFALGSTRDEVLAIQGTPDRFTSDSFHYGTSDVFFQHGRVVSWRNSFPRLKVQMLPANPTTASRFTLGSTRDEVLAIQGAPDRFTSDSFHYGTSDVFFQHGRVVGWRNIYPRLRVDGRPQEGLSPES